MKNQRLFGWANLLSAVLLLLATILFYTLPVGEIASDYSQLVAQDGWSGISLISLLAVYAGAVGLVGIYLYQREQGRALLLIGFLLSLGGLLTKFAAGSWELAIWPVLLESHPESPLLSQSLIYQAPAVLLFYALFTLLTLAGTFLLGLASLRSGRFPRWCALLLMVGGPAYAVLLSLPPFGILGILLYTGAIGGMGITLLRRQT